MLDQALGTTLFLELSQSLYIRVALMLELLIACVGHQYVVKIALLLKVLSHGHRARRLCNVIF